MPYSPKSEDETYKKLNYLKSKAKNRKSSQTFPKPNITIGIGHFINAIIILTFLININPSIRNTRLRQINLVLPPIDYTGHFEIKPIGYGEIAIIIDGGNNFYIHLRDHYFFGNLDRFNREKELEIGLNEDNLRHINRKQLSEVIQCYQEEGVDYAITFSITNNAKYLDMILMLDLLEFHKVNKYALLKIRNEEKTALMNKKCR